MSFSFNIMGPAAGSVIATKNSDLFLETLEILNLNGVNIDGRCLQKSVLNVYNSFDKTPDRLYPIAYETLNENGVNVDVECLSETTKSLLNE